MSRVSLPVCLALLGALLAPSPSVAANLDEISGKPLIENNGHIHLNGKQIDFWGIDLLEDDQQCWRNNVAWDCGAQAWAAFTHYIADQSISCRIKGLSGDNMLIAQCFLDQNGQKTDIAAHLASEGWALDKPEHSHDMYEDEEESARAHRRGIWTSRFQTPADWKNGTKRYVEYDMEPDPQTAHANAQIIVGPAEYVIEPESPSKSDN